MLAQPHQAQGRLEKKLQYGQNTNYTEMLLNNKHKKSNIWSQPKDFSRLQHEVGPADGVLA